MILFPMTDRYIHMSLTCDIQSGAIYNLQFILIKLRNNIACIMWNDTFNACVDSREYCSHIFACIGHNNPNVFTIVRYINIDLYGITRAYQSCILTYHTCVSLPSTCAHGNLQTYPPGVYHVYMGINLSPLPQHQGNLPLPLFGGTFLVILHAFIIQNYHKISQIVTLFSS